MNSTETPGGSGIPAGWYDDPSGEGLRWWDGEQWTEHVHTAESAAVASGDTAEVSREGKPPRDLVRLRESIRGRGVKGVGIVLGAIVLVIVVVALLVSGGGESSGSSEPGAGLPPVTKAAAAKARKTEKQIQKIDQQLSDKKLSKAQKTKLQAQKTKLEKSAGKSAEKQIKAAEKAAKEALKKAED